MVSADESVRLYAVPPVPPRENTEPDVSVIEMASSREPPRSVIEETLGEAGKDGRSLNQVLKASLNQEKFCLYCCLHTRGVRHTSHSDGE